MSCATIVAVALLAACSDSTRPGTDLTTEQVQSMASALGTLLGTSLGQPQATLTSPRHFEARWVTDLQNAYSQERTCPEQGRLGISGTGSTDSLGGLHLLTTDTLADCGIKDSHGDVWRFTSQPVLTTTLDLTSTDVADFDIAHTDVGSVTYSTGALSGTCSIDVAIASHTTIGSPTADSATTSIHTDGTVCGRTVSRDTVITSPWGHP